MSRYPRYYETYSYAGSSSSYRSRSRSPRPSRSKNRLPTVLTDLFGEDECRLCCVEMSSSIIAKMHYGGKPHYKKMKRFLTEWCAQTGMPMIELEEPRNTAADNDLNDYCEYCNVHYTSLNDKLIHISGKKHKKNEEDPANAKKKNKAYEVLDVEQLQYGMERYVTPPTAASTSKSFLCEVCDVKAVSYDQLQVHMAGKKHKEKLEKLNSMAKHTTLKPFYCKECDVGLDTRQLFQLHLQGRTHAKTLQKKEENKKNNIPKECKLTCDFCPYVGNIEEHECDESLKKLGENYETIGEKFACPPCIMMFDSLEELEDHKNTRRHFIVALNTEKGDKVIEELAHFYCRYCKVQSRSNKDYTDHLFEQKHAERFQLMTDLESKHMFHCQICDLYMDVDAKDDHLRDRTHVKKSVVSEIQNHLTGWAREESTPKNFHCDDCDELFYNFLSYSKHMLSDKHVEGKIYEYLGRLES